MALTIFDRYGGFATVRKVVSAFYDKGFDAQHVYALEGELQRR